MTDIEQNFLDFARFRGAEAFSWSLFDGFERIHAGEAEFYVVRENVAHSKLYLLEGGEPPRRRVIAGSANLSERAFAGKQPETLLVFDDDDGAWDHYSREYDAVKRTASNRIDLPVDLKEVLTPSVKAELKKLRWVKGGQEEENSRPVRLSIDRGSRHISLSGDTVPLEVDREGLAQSARAIVEYFDNYERGFIGDVRRLQRGYFTFMSWLYASPFGRSPARGSRWSGARPPAAASPGPASSTWSRPWWRWTAGGCGGAGRC